MKDTIYRILVGLFFIFKSQLITAQSFTKSEESSFLNDVFIRSMACADIDGDQDLDLFISGSNDSEGRFSKTYTNDGNGSFSASSGNTFEDFWATHSVFTDIDGDNDDDLVFYQVGNGIKLFSNDGNGNFTQLSDTSFKRSVRGTLACGDVDGDDDIDIVISGQNPDRFTILYINDGKGVFTESTNNTFRGLTYGTLEFVDTDSDNDLDLFITGFDGIDNYAELYLNDGDASFSKTTNKPRSFGGKRDGFCDFADVDGDGYTDFITTGRPNTFKSTTFYKNYGEEDLIGHFKSDILTFEDVDHSAVAFADFDNDGDMDVLLSGEDNSEDPFTEIYTNDGLGNFESVGNLGIEQGLRSVAVVADLNSDGYDDILIAGADGSGIFSNSVTALYFNDGVSVSQNEISLKNERLLKLYPNPNKSDYLHLDYTPIHSNSFSIKIFDSMGNLILEKEQTGFIGSLSKTSLCTESLAHGIYHVEILESSSHRKIAKFIK